MSMSPENETTPVRNSDEVPIAEGARFAIKGATEAGRLQTDTVRTIDALNVWRGISLVLPAAGALAAITLGESIALAGGLLSLLVLAGTKLASEVRGKAVREAIDALSKRGALMGEEKARLDALSNRMTAGEVPFSV